MKSSATLYIDDVFKIEQAKDSQATQVCYKMPNGQVGYIHSITVDPNNIQAVNIQYHMDSNATVNVYDNINLGADVVMTWPKKAFSPNKPLVQDSLHNHNTINVDAGTVQSITRSSDKEYF